MFRLETVVQQLTVVLLVSVRFSYGCKVDGLCFGVVATHRWRLFRNI
jgi:hypothetical protein